MELGARFRNNLFRQFSFFFYMRVILNMKFYIDLTLHINSTYILDKLMSNYPNLN